MGKREREEAAAAAYGEEEEEKKESSLWFVLEKEQEQDEDEDNIMTGSFSELEEEEEEEKSEEGGFGAEFDGCSLLSKARGGGEGAEGSNSKRHKPKRQTNLFQIWGLPNNNKKPPPKQKQKQKQKQANLFQIWGLSNNNPTPTITNNNNPPPPPRACPFYKKIPGTPFTVDAFRYGQIQGCKGYLLTHFHADHYSGLTKSWSHGPIYCTPLTASLLNISLYVNPLYIHPLELDTAHVVEGIKVTLLEANHCPGAALIHLRLPNGQSVLHTGDFRANKLMQQYPLLANQPVNLVYLDTTYCNNKFRFPAKEDVLRFVVGVVENCLRKQPKTLIIVGAYTIGKECVYIAIAEALGVKIHVDSRRRRILQSFGWPGLSATLTSDGKETPLHVLPISSLKFEVLERYLKTYTNRYTAVLAFRPTGWTYSESIGSRLDLIKPTSKGQVTIYGVPYSEHSSFVELEEFIKFLKPDKIIPTVNVGNAAHRDKMQCYFREWLK